MNDWRATVGLLSSQLGVAFPERSLATDRQIDDFIRPDLRHHRHRADTLLQRDDIADCVKQAYRCFSAAIESSMIDHAALDRIAGALDEAEATLEHMTHSSIRPVRAIEAGPSPPEARDTLTALMLAEIEQARDVAVQSQRLVSEMRATWSWRFTKPLRALGRTAGRLIGK